MIVTQHCYASELTYQDIRLVTFGFAVGCPVSLSNITNFLTRHRKHKCGAQNREKHSEYVTFIGIWPS